MAVNYYLSLQFLTNSLQSSELLPIATYHHVSNYFFHPNYFCNEFYRNAFWKL